MKYVDSGRIAKFWIPDDYILVEQFEKTGTGKIDKKPLRQRLSN
jgi:fatty-acyl-CoA synthase